MRITGGDNIQIDGFSGYNQPADPNKAVHGLLVNDSSSAVGQLTINGMSVDNPSGVAFQFDHADKSKTRISGLSTDESNIIASANTITLSPGHDTFQIQGTVQIDNIAASSGWQGRTVHLLFQDGGCAVSATGNIRPRPGYTSTGLSTLSLFTVGGDFWREIGRTL